MIVFLSLPRGEGIPWPAAEQPARGLRTAPPEEAPVFGIVIRPGTGDAAPPAGAAHSPGNGV